MVSQDVVYNIRRKLKNNCKEINDYGDNMEKACRNKDYCEIKNNKCVFDKSFIKNI